MDVRLALGAAAAWFVLVCCLGRSVATVLVVSVVAAASGALALVWPVLVSGRRRDGAGVRVANALALVGFCVALVLVPFAGRSALARASPLSNLAAHHQSATVEFTVTGDPHALAARGPSGASRVAVTGHATAVTSAGRRWRVGGDLLVLAEAAPWRDVLPGQQVRVDATLAPALDPSSTETVVFARSPPVLLGRPPWWQRAAGTVRGSLRVAAAGLPDPERGLLPGLVDGDTADLDPVLVERFRVAGLTHLIAVSGTNCSIVVGTVLLVLRWRRVRPWVCALVGGLVLVAFVVVARPSPSVLRAALMAAIALVSLATGRPRQAVPALSAAVLGLLLWDPALAADVGFAMSALATAALLVLAPSWAAALRRRGVPLGMAEAVAVAAAAHLVTAPVIAAISGRISVVAVPANVLAEPVVAPATVLGFAAALLAPWWLGAGRVCADLAGWPCRWLVWVGDHLGALPGAALPWPGGTGGGLLLLGVSAALVVLALHAGFGRLLSAAVLVAALVQIPLRVVLPGWPPPGWLMVACDVGQGDAIVLAAGGHSAVEIDAGPDAVTIDRCLRDLGVSEVALLVLTHYHLDHVGGIVGVLHERRVGRVVTGPLAEPVSGVQSVAAATSARGLTVTSVTAGRSFTAGRVRLDVLGPVTAFHGTRSDPNNSSVVVRATIDGTVILLPGDAEVEAQQALLDAGVDLRADVLKVPHHGSAYSSAQFLAAVRARVAVISVGAGNDYGHPSPLLLGELARLGVPVRRTDRDGDVAVVGPATRLTTVTRGASRVVASAAAESAVSAPVSAPGTPPRGTLAGETALPRRVDLSAVGARMGPWQRVRSVSTNSRIRYRQRCCSWAMRNYSSPGQSARSPPPAGPQAARMSN